MKLLKDEKERMKLLKDENDTINHLSSSSTISL